MDRKLNIKLIKKIIFLLTVISFISVSILKVKDTIHTFSENNKKIKLEKREWVMNNYVSTIKEIIELSDTMVQAMDYINLNMNKENYIQAEVVVKDTNYAIETIDKALNPIYKELDMKKLEKETKELKKNCYKLKESLNNNDIDKSKEIMKDKIYDSFKIWKKDLDKELKKYTLS